MQAVRAQSTEEKGGEIRSDPKSMADKLQDYNKERKNQKVDILWALYLNGPIIFDHKIYSS